MEDTTKETATPADEIMRILKARAKRNYDIVLGNLQIGKIVGGLCETNGEDAVTELATSLSSQGIKVTENFLFRTWRVYRSVGNEKTLRTLRHKTGGNLSWGFLLEHHERAPQGDTNEARLYWENVLSHIEEALEDIETIKANGPLLPPDISDQVQGLLTMTERSQLQGPLLFALMPDVQMTERLTCGKAYKYDPETGLNVRAIDIATGVNTAADIAIARMCRFVVYPGDLMDHPKPWPNEEALMLEPLVRLSRRMPVIVFPGNHDLPQKPQDHSALEFLKNRENIIVIEKPTILYLEGQEVRTTPSPSWPQNDCAKIFILPFPSRSARAAEMRTRTIAEINQAVSASLEGILSGWTADIDDRVPNLLFSHITVPEAEGVEESMVEFDPVIRLAYLMPFDFVGLGHIHRHQRIASSEAHYVGSIERMDHGEENDTKGFMITTMHGRKPASEFVELPARPFATLTPEFFDEEGWREKIDGRTIYRIKGTVTKERYAEISKQIRDIDANIVNSLTVESDVRVRDAQMTESLTEREALERYLSEHLSITDDTFRNDVIRAFNSIATEAK